MRRAKLFDLAWLESRVNEEGDCLVWTGAITRYGQPQAEITTDGKKGTVLVRRMVWEAVHERPMQTHWWTFARCGTYGCVHPDHIGHRTRSAATRGKKRSRTNRAAIAKARREQSPWTHEELLAAANTDLSNVEAAALVGCSHSYISRIRHGKARVDFSNPFAGLGAR